MKYLSEARTDEQRRIIYGKFRQWMIEGLLPRDDVIDLLIQLLDKSDINELLHAMTERDEQIIHALAGPNGWTVYKMILAKKSAAA